MRNAEPMPYDLPSPQPRTLVLANARILLETETLTGSLVVRDGRIAAVDTGPAVPPGAEDCGGDYLAPGLVELHTDNLEGHLEPRPGVQASRQFCQRLATADERVALGRQAMATGE